MILRKVFMASGLAIAMLGCASKVVQTTEYSGYLGDYTGLQEVKSPTGEPTKRWMATGADLGSYSAVYLKPTQFYPEPQPNEKVDNAALKRIAQHCDQALAREIGKVRPLVNKPGPGVLVFAPAITAVTSNKESFKPYEVIPIALVVAGVTTAAGTRDEDSNLYVEVLATDASTSKPVLKTVRKIRGESLENSATKISGTTFDKAIDAAAVDARLIFRQQ